MEKRSHYKYELKKGNKLLYVGITNDPQRRLEEHTQTKKFGHMVIVGNASTKVGAENWETKRIETYARNHGGEIPPKNKTKNGK